jgi:hypothetical protein
VTGAALQRTGPRSPADHAASSTRTGNDERIPDLRRRRARYGASDCRVYGASEGGVWRGTDAAEADRITDGRRAGARTDAVRTDRERRRKLSYKSAGDWACDRQPGPATHARSSNCWT